MRKLKLEEGQLAIQEIQQNAEMKRVAQEAENSIQKMHRDEEQEAKKWEWEKEDRPTALNQKLFDAKTAEYNFEILTSKTSATFMIANLQKEAQIHEELDELAKEAQKLWDEADELKELKEKWKKYEAIQGIEEKRLAFLKDAKEKSQANEKENERLLEAIGGEDKAAEASLLAIVAENLKDDPVFSMPGAFPDRRRRRNHFNRPPIMLHEQTDSCDTEHCHRLWYTRHRTANNKRSASGRSSSHHPWGDIIHDFHVTPVDFYFTDAGTLQRRDPTDEEEFSAFEDCEEEVTFGEGDQRTTFYSRILSQYGGDAASLDLFASIPPEDFIKAMRKDLDKIPTEEIDGHEYSRVLGVGMNCGKIDFDEQDNPAAKNARAVKNETAVGNPPAVWFAYTLSNTTEYSHKDPKELMTLCENYFKK
ncbi:uncharacterized protein N7459_007586 [Penicillium hispanicum]|uniref:uncharacterized protein n=1 Tax=Penicillium hispanicum TaxID=1080232 RepID=UPI002540FA79|nr:uncharacterized protein N7459_007586 [Penicillium hispanicum]KAJ5578622.1 hypothetical protein N7459_007586 [Penicillium hispanicum]